MRFSIGDATVDIIVDDDNFTLPLSEFFPGADPELLERHGGTLEPEFFDRAAGLARFAIQSFVLRTGGKTLLIDCCIGDHKDIPEIPAWHQRRGSGFLDRLRQTGVDPAEVDLVFCTHLHVDHVGWNTQADNGRWKPTFPNARYLFGRRELADWMAQHDAGRALPIHARALEQSVIPIVEAKRCDLVTSDHAVEDLVSLIPTPGHTIDHYAVQLGRAGKDAVITGDLIHSPLQARYPELAMRVDYDPAQGAATRRKFLETYCDTNTLCCFAHFPSPSRGYVKRWGNGFKCEYITD